MHRTTFMLLAPLLLCGQSPIAGFPPGTFAQRGALDAAAAPAAYSGPGDAVASASMWWGLRGYNAAFSGAVANICDQATGLVCADATWASGTLSFPLIGGIACNNVTNICIVKTLYDQTGNGFTLNNAGGVTTWPTLTLSCIGSLPCMTFAVASLQCLNTTGTYVQASPYSFEWVGNRSGTVTAQRAISTTSRFTGWTAAADTITVSGGSTLSKGSVTDAAFHAVQAVVNGASGSLSADGSTTAGTTGSTTTGGTVGFGGNATCAGTIDGKLTEGGIWPIAFSAQNITDLNSNAHSYWGF